MARLDDLHPAFRPAAEFLVEVAEFNRIPVRVTSTYRSCRAQKALYDEWIMGARRLPAAPPGRSLHNIGLAVDISASPEALRALGDLWTSWGGWWGGERDPVHFGAFRSLPPGRFCR